MKGMSKSCQIRKNELAIFFLDKSLKTNRKAVQLKVVEQTSALMHVKGIVQA